MEDQAPKQSRVVLWWVVFLLALIIAIAAWLVWSDREPTAVDNLAAIGQVGQGSASSDFEPQLLVDDQVPGEVVHVTTVAVDGGAWVAIHRDQAGSPGAILGAGYFDNRVSTGAVDLDQPTIAGATYYAVLYHDTGNDQRFAGATEVPWLNQAGQALIIPFQITGASDLEEDKG